jgi:hypothetical protein
MKEIPAGGPDRRLCRFCVGSTAREQGYSGLQPDPDAGRGLHQDDRRTFFQYIVRPIHDSMMRAFRALGETTQEGKAAIVHIDIIETSLSLAKLEDNWSNHDADDGRRFSCHGNG